TRAGHDVVMVEPDSGRAHHCAETYDARVVQADIGDDGVAEEADLADAQAVIATTGDDSANLMAMFLARESGTPMLATVANLPSHRGLFEKLGARVLVDPEVLVAQHLMDAAIHPETVDITTLPGHRQIIQVALAEGAPLEELTLREAEEQYLQKRMAVVARERDERVGFPDPETRLKAGDLLTVLSLSPATQKDLALFTGRG
ncbi:MAG TPA: TrkA family potassium uptake protein, partial [Gammaproteobacteria bacterium]|nr:TrkA family potassium uptake protein [Gammaproteobacteria bacterium]